MKPPEILELPDLIHLAEHADEVDWQPFRDGVEIHRLYGDGISGPSASLMRFSTEGKIPFHHHDGYEHILVLAGSQRDEHGVISTGTLRVHPPGTSHQVISDAGCLILAIYKKPVRFE